MKRFKPRWVFIEIFLSGLTTAIFINYLFTGFMDIVFNINSFLTWLAQPNQVTVINRLIEQVFRR